MRRGSHKGVHELWCHRRRVLLINLRYDHDAKTSPYSDLQPAARAAVFRSGAQVQRAIKQGKLSKDPCRRAAPTKAARRRHASARTAEVDVADQL